MRSRPRDLGAIATALVTVVAAMVLGSYLALRVSTPSEPATVPTSTWHWSTTGVEVVPVGPETPFQPGDRVVGIAGRPLGEWADAAFDGSSDPGAIVDPLPMAVERDGSTIRIEAALGAYPILSVLAESWPLVVFTLAQLGLASYLLARRPRNVAVRILFVGSVANLASVVPWQLGVLPTDLVRGLPALLPFMATGPLELVFWSSLVHLLMEYPIRRSVLVRRPWLMSAIYGLPIVLLLLVVVALRMTTASTLAWIGTWVSVQAWAVLILLVIGIVGLAVSAREMPRPVIREVRWVVVALLVAGVGTLLLVVGPLALTGEALASRGLLALLALPVPITLAIAIARDRMFERDQLPRAREQLVRAREEERRRLRRRLHDGIGPTLAGMTVQLDVATGQLATDPNAAAATLARLKVQAQEMLAEIRDLARELRPPALDDLGLAAALRQGAEQLSTTPGHPTMVTVTVPAPLPALPAAVEVAAYRIATEAMVNAVRHGSAGRCDVTLTVAGPLYVEVTDDGRGLPLAWEPGVGVSAMRERARELGGTLTVGPRDGGGTRVIAALPWQA